MKKPIILAVISNIVPLFCAPLTTLLIASHFSPEVQGYYYTFNSLISVQFLFEFGIGQTMVALMSHEWAKLSFDSREGIVGNKESLARLVGYNKISLKWYTAASAAFISIFILVGHYFFPIISEDKILWWNPWISLCILSGFNLALTPLFNLLMGCNLISHYWFFRLVQQVIYGVSIWVAIFFGADLWTGSIAFLSCLIWSGLFWAKKDLPSLRELFRFSLAKTINWRKSIWPNQWRAAIGWMNGFLLPILFAPMVFKYSGPVAAGQIGMTATLNVMLIGISGIAVTTKAPLYGLLVARGKFKEMNDCFMSAFWVSILIASLGMLGIWSLVYILNEIQHPFARRLLRPLPTALFLAGTFFNLLSYNFNVYFRSYNKEYLGVINLISFVSVVLLIELIGIKLGLDGIPALYLAVLAFFQFPVSLRLFKRFRPLSL